MFAPDSTLEEEDLPPISKRKKQGNNLGTPSWCSPSKASVAPCSLCQGRLAPAPPVPPHSRRHPSEAFPRSFRENNTGRSSKPRLNRGPLDGRRDRPLGGERAVDLIDRSASRLEADERDRCKREDIPGGEVVHGRDQRVYGCLRADEVRRPGDQRQPGRTDGVGELRGAALCGVRACLLRPPPSAANIPPHRSYPERQAARESLSPGAAFCPGRPRDGPARDPWGRYRPWAGQSRAALGRCSWISPPSGSSLLDIKGKASTSMGTVDPRSNIHGDVDLRAALTTPAEGTTSKLVRDRGIAIVS